ncbi:hypothetical protein [Streptomyces chattanoogensis]|uniref:hypothetical protein n=1 Tax=Streptomyces chattanoogensis TaxID=66876 RepID=UPI0036A6F53F
MSGADNDVPRGSDPRQGAERPGTATVHQEFTPVPGRTVAGKRPRLLAGQAVGRALKAARGEKLPRTVRVPVVPVTQRNAAEFGTHG